MGEISSDRIASAVERAVASGALELVHWELKGQGPGALLRVTIDCPDGISHDHCSQVSRELEALLDEDDLVPFEYTLEVTSPGLGRAIGRSRAEFQRQLGEVVRIRTSEPCDGRISFKGAVQRVGEAEVEIVERDGAVHSIPIAKILVANLVQVPRMRRGATQEAV
jgi:ribosome maturation factor RimP